MMGVDISPDRPSRRSGLWAFMDTLHPIAKGMAALLFLFTIWSILTGFDLGSIMNKYADAQLEQNKMQFEAQIELQKMQFQATEESNDKLSTIGDSIVLMAREISTISERISALELTVSQIAIWTCQHERNDKPGYCAALKKQPEATLGYAPS